MEVLVLQSAQRSEGKTERAQFGRFSAVKTLQVGQRETSETINNISGEPIETSTDNKVGENSRPFGVFTSRCVEEGYGHSGNTP